jgi:hypothetical protein
MNLLYAVKITRVITPELATVDGSWTATGPRGIAQTARATSLSSKRNKHSLAPSY